MCSKLPFHRTSKIILSSKIIGLWIAVSISAEIFILNHNSLKNLGKRSPTAAKLTIFQDKFVTLSTISRKKKSMWEETSYGKNKLTKCHQPPPYWHGSNSTQMGWWLRECLLWQKILRCGDLIPETYPSAITNLERGQHFHLIPFSRYTGPRTS